MLLRTYLLGLVMGLFGRADPCFFFNVFGVLELEVEFECDV
jgi:hypothetical protein